MRTTMRRARTALVTGVLGLGMAAAFAAPASAASFVTPKYGMTCETAVTGSFGGYNGHATCYAPVEAKWRVRVDCTAGGTYESHSVYTGPANGWYTLGPSPTCFWGVNGISVIELN